MHGQVYIERKNYRMLYKYWEWPGGGKFCRENRRFRNNDCIARTDNQSLPASFSFFPSAGPSVEFSISFTTQPAKYDSTSTVRAETAISEIALSCIFASLERFMICIRIVVNPTELHLWHRFGYSPDGTPHLLRTESYCPQWILKESSDAP